MGRILEKLSHFLGPLVEQPRPDDDLKKAANGAANQSNPRQRTIDRRALAFLDVLELEEAQPDRDVAQDPQDRTDKAGDAEGQTANGDAAVGSPALRLRNPAQLKESATISAMSLVFTSTCLSRAASVIIVMQKGQAAATVWG